MSLLNSVIFQPPDPALCKIRIDGAPEHVLVTKPNGGQLSVLNFNAQGSVSLLYSHGNAEDLGESYYFLRDLAGRLKANIIAYDYSGYGLSSGYPTEENVYDDAEFMYNFVTKGLGVPPRLLILWGRSLGSGPTCYLASRYDECIGGVVIVSGFTSCVATVVPRSILCAFACIDQFPNEQHMRDVSRTRLLFMHGRCDEVVPFDHGKTLQKVAQQQNSEREIRHVWFDNRGHNDILQHTDSAGMYLSGLRNIVETVRAGTL